jgi:hypothetical protein
MGASLIVAAAFFRPDSIYIIFLILVNTVQFLDAPSGPFIFRRGYFVTTRSKL